jgi:hypothetical protein
MLKSIAIFFTLLTLITSCGSSSKNQTNPTSSKLVYSLMAKDNVGLNAIFSDELKKHLKGEMMINALTALQKTKGEMKAIELMESQGNTSTYSIKMKRGESPLKVSYNENNQVDKIWLDNKVLGKK